MRLGAAVRLCAGALLLAGCPDSSGPVAGELVVSIEGPAVRAAMLRVVGEQSAIALAPAVSAQLHVGVAGEDTAIVVLVAPRGSVLPSGDVFRLSVPDVNRLSAYSVTTLQAAGAGYQLLAASSLIPVITR